MNCSERQLFSNLPSELLAQVSSYLLRECAAVSVRAELHAKSGSFGMQPQQILMNVRRDIYADFVNLEGIQYVKRLCDSTLQASSQGRLLNVQSKSLPSSIYVAEDHLGIRLVLFGRPDKALREQSKLLGLWWNIVNIDADTEVKTETDVSCRRSEHVLSKGVRA
jgi:hypothetical protein